MQPLIVVSAERFFRGGTVKAVRLCLQELAVAAAGSCRIRALVYRQDDYPALPGVEYLSFPRARTGWWRRLYYEYWLFPRLARRWKPVLWLSLQDSTPPVCSRFRAVYFHHPLVFARLPWRMWLKQPGLLMLKWLYQLVYLRNIRFNDWVFVQQHQLREQLLRRYALNPHRVWVIPLVKPLFTETDKKETHPQPAVFRFFFPAYPYVYKNHLVLLAAASRLVQQGIRNFEIVCTYDENQNAYIRKLRQGFPADLPIRFTGYLQTHALEAWYHRADALVFPSLCETWGLPLSEAAALGLPILAADLPYARETLSDYRKVCWLPPLDVEAWAKAMESMIRGNFSFAERTEKLKQPSAFELSWAQWLQLWLHQLQSEVKHAE